ncbi:hypothetical protein [Corallibacter sp.]|uniref:hypothetical protein n=1 Tax=Corallibacter sp. TaxID=2038084 RepID=UPI003AB7A96E
MQSSSTVLSFYFDMLFVNSINAVKSSFIGNQTLINNGYSYIPEYEQYEKEQLFEDGVSPVFVSDYIEREQFFERLLNFENTSIYKNIEAEILKSLDEKEKATYLTNVFNDIKVLLKRVLKLDDDEVRLIEDKLIEIISNLKDRYSSIILYHNAYSYLIKETDITFFKNKDLKYSFYTDLYEIAYSLYLIDDVETEERDFINAFSTDKPQVLENKIRFTQSNYIVAYFLEALKPFFNGFTRVAIENSNVFLNKQNKPFTSKDLDTAMSRGKDKNIEEKTKIDSLISELKNKHLE